MDRPFVDIKIVSVPGGPDPETSGIHRFYTVAFDAGVMKQVLSFDGRFGVLEAGTWIDAVVPKCYQTRVREIVARVVEENFIGLKYKPETMDMVILELRRAIWRDLEPIHPSRCEH